MTKKQNVIIYELCDGLVEINRQLKEMKTLFSLNQVNRYKNFCFLTLVRLQLENFSKIDLILNIRKKMSLRQKMVAILEVGPNLFLINSKT